jgi:hypothetical protein
MGCGRHRRSGTGNNLLSRLNTARAVMKKKYKRLRLRNVTTPVGGLRPVEVIERKKKKKK